MGCHHQSCRPAILTSRDTCTLFSLNLCDDMLKNSLMIAWSTLQHQVKLPNRGAPVSHTWDFLVTILLLTCQA